MYLSDGITVLNNRNKYHSYAISNSGDLKWFTTLNVADILSNGDFIG